MRDAAIDPRRVEALFDAVVDLAPAEAHRLLGVECVDAPEVRRLVELLLAHDRRGDESGLASAPHLLLDALLEECSADDLRPAPSRIGRFRVLERIGEGAMGVVYAGHDEVLDRRVALKLLRGEAMTSDWLLREGQALGRVAHPNVVTVYEVGEHGGSVYLAMELIEGPTLRAWLAEERRAFGDLLRVFLAVGRGLGAVHEAGLMHRDFKPDNILIGADGRPRIADFGIAAPSLALAPARLTPRPWTLESTIAGTPAFMAPEVLEGARASAASDQWSFCAALYRTTYGAPPYPLDGGLEDVARRIREGPPPVPPRRADVPSWLAPILLRGLSPIPGERFPTMAALLLAIERNLPRDPDLDPEVVRHDVGILRLAVFVAGLFAGLLVGVGPIPIAPTTLASVSAGLLLVEIAVIALRWRSLAQNAFGRRSVALVTGTTAAILLHRLLAIEMETPFPQILVIDLLLIALVYGFAAMAIDRWVAALAIVAMAAAAAAAHFPALAIPAFLIGALGTFLIATLDAFRRR